MFFQQLSHFSTTCMHSVITGISSPPSFPKTYLSKPNQGVLMHMTAGPRLLSLWAKTAFSTNLSKKTNESNSHPLALLFTWIQIRKVYHISHKEGTLPLPLHWTRSWGKTPSSTRIPFFPLGKGFFVKWCNTKDQAYIKAIYLSMAATLTPSNTTPLEQMISNKSCINS